MCAIGVGSAASDNGGPPPPRRDHGHGKWFEQVCTTPSARAAACQAQVVSDESGVPLVGNSPAASALGPAQFSTAYNLPTGTPAGQPTQTIAIVDAYDDPSTEADLAVFSTRYGLPRARPRTAASRRSTRPAARAIRRNTGWALEIALDVETAHEICQNCKILLVEAIAPRYEPRHRENEAAALGANASRTRGAPPSLSRVQVENAYFNHPGIALTFATGDSATLTASASRSLVEVRDGRGRDVAQPDAGPTARTARRCGAARAPAARPMSRSRLAGRLRLRQAHDRRRRRPTPTRTPARPSTSPTATRAGTRWAAPRSRRR